MKINDLMADLQEADGIVILAGAGMGVDAGIPDFRGKSGVWTAEKDTFMKYSKASSFHDHPLDAWNFYITRFLTYRDSPPHQGYHSLLTLPKDIFVVTSNIDGHFIASGYDRAKIYEIHGNLEYIQCSKRCGNDTQPMPKFDATLTHEDEMPRCPKCSAPSRPQVMLFNDPWFVPRTVNTQSLAYLNWAVNKKRIVGIEIGAGLAVPSIRMFGEERTYRLIRINPNDYQIGREGDLAIPLGAQDGIDIVMKLFKGEKE